MSTIINTLTNGVALFNNYHNITGSYGISGDNGADVGGDGSNYNIVSHGQSFYNFSIHHNFLHEDGGGVDSIASLTAGTTSGFSDGDKPSLQNLAPALNDASIERLKFIMLGAIGSVVAVLGFLGNIMSMVVLQQRQMRSSTSYYLLSLAIYDNLILLGMVIYFIIPSLASHFHFMKDYRAAYSITEPIGYPLSLTAQMGSIYTCVGFTVERFIAVCRPLQVANTCTKSRTIRAIILIFVWAVLYNIPRFFHLQAVYFYHETTTSSGQENVGITSPDMTSFDIFSVSGSSNSSVPVQPMPSHHTLLPEDHPCHSEPTSGATPLYASLSSPCLFAKNISDYVQNSPSMASSYRNNNNDNNNKNQGISSSLFSDIFVPHSSLQSSSPSPLLPSSSSSSPQQSYSDFLSTISQPLSSPSVLSSTSPLSTLLSASVPMSSSSSITNPRPSTSTSGKTPVKYVMVLDTPFGADPLFRNIYLIYSQLFFMFLVPFIIILFMNIGLIRAVKRSKSMRQHMGSSASARKERNLTVMLIAVIVVFLVCQFPTIIDNILIAVFGAPKLYPNYQYQCFFAACTLMVLINSASNFLLYCFFGKKFRVVFLSLMGIKKRQQYVAYRSTMYRSRSNGSRACDVEVSVV